MADLEHGLTIHELELAETISGDSFVAIDDGTNTKKAKIANLNSASAQTAQTYAQAAAASAAASASSATQAQTSAQSIQSAMVQATSQLQGYVDDAAASASSAAASEANIRGLITSDYAKLARSYATGDSGYREGEETDNAKYYSEQSESYVDDAAAQAVIAGQKADLAEDHALESEGHALGTQNGTPVSSDSPYYHNNAKYWADEARQSSAGGVAASVIATAEPTNISSHAYAIGDQFVYNGILYTATSAISVGATIIPGTNCSISDTITEQIGNAGHTIVDEEGTTYPQRSKLQFEGCEVTDDAVNGVTVVKCEGGGAKKYAKPTITVGTYTYDGTTQAPTITGFDANVMTLTGTYEAINAGSYTFTIALKDKYESKWEDNTRDDIVTNWSINAISVAVPTVTNITKTYNGSAQSPTITRDTANTTVSGTTSATKVKSNYSFSIALTDTTNHKWSDNTTAAKSYTWKINPPTGSSYTPVNNIQAWLQCASIGKTYTTIAQVLADATTLSALMLSNNAADYLVRSTSWVSNITGNQTAMTDIGTSDYCADTLLANSTWRTAICDSTYFENVLTTKSPNMTSNTTPSGTVSASYVYSGRAAWWAFDGNTPDPNAGRHYWYNPADTTNNLSYTFDNTLVLYKVTFKFAHGTTSQSGSKITFQYSSDNSTWEDGYTWTIGSETSTLTDHECIIKSTKAKYYRFYVNKAVGSGVSFGAVHLYGRA